MGIILDSRYFPHRNNYKKPSIRFDNSLKFRNRLDISLRIKRISITLKAYMFNYMHARETLYRI